MPLSLRFTRSTSSAWRSIGMLRWMMPMPPCCASAMARCDSVTVSMAELTMGMFSRDVPGQTGARVGLRRHHAAARRLQEYVVESKTF